MPMTSTGIVTLWLTAAIAVPQTAEPTWSAVVAGAGDTTCGIRSDRSLWCWGFNGDGQIGDGTTETRTRPARVGAATTWSVVAPTDGHTCGVRTDGSLWCWGRNGDGQLGTGEDDGTRTSPVRVGTATDWTSVATGGGATCGLRTDGSLWCWGDNGGGQLGDGTTDDRRTPVRIGADTDWADIDMNGTTCGLRTTGALWCWGSDHGGIAGGQAETAQTAPARVGTSSSWTSVTAGYSDICAVDSRHDLWCWSSGPADRPDTPVPAPAGFGPQRVGAGLSWSDVTLGRGHTCALRTNGEIWCWGDNDAGEVGDGTTARVVQPAHVNADLSWSAITAGGDRTCALTTAGALWCWGANGYGQLGDGTTSPPAGNEPLPVQPAARWRQVTAGLGHTCALTTAGALWCWGDNDAGQLGDGTNDTGLPPRRVSDAPWKSVSAGWTSTCGVDGAGALWCWGAEFGGGNRSDEPRRIGTGTTWTGVSTGTSHACALRHDGSLWCWGSNVAGQLGTADEDPVTAPVRARTDLTTTWTSVSVGTAHTCASDVHGELWCWGADDKGQRGDEKTGDPWSPPIRPGGRTVTTASAAYDDSCAITADKSLWCWCDNSNGQVGAGRTDARPLPGRVGESSGWTTVTVGRGHTCGVRADRSLWCWGSNSAGQLGDGTFTDRHRPVRVGDGTAWQSVSAGESHTCALRTDRSLWCWGDNRQTQLGVLTPVRRPVATTA
jgi:alpha-tubulin suppressor-like RCC1 family protein